MSKSYGKMALAIGTSRSVVRAAVLGLAPAGAQVLIQRRGDAHRLLQR
jgi:hypothetical protein